MLWNRCNDGNISLKMSKSVSSNFLKRWKEKHTFWHSQYPTKSRSDQSTAQSFHCMWERWTRRNPIRQWQRQNRRVVSGTVGKRHGFGPVDQMLQFGAVRIHLAYIQIFRELYAAFIPSNDIPRAPICSLVLTGWNPTNGTCMLANVPIAYQEE